MLEIALRSSTSPRSLGIGLRSPSPTFYKSEIGRDCSEIAGVGASTVPRSLQIGPRSPSPTFFKSKIGRDCTEIAGDWGFYTSKFARDCSEIAESHVL